LLLDKYLRMRSMWIVIYPLFVFIAISLITQISVFFMLPIFLPVFPIGILVGSGISVDSVENANKLLTIGFIVVVFILYAWFIIRIKKISGTALRMVSFCLIAVSVLGIKGCVLMINQTHF